MKKGLRFETTRGMSRDAWLAKRRKTIGGSDAAAIVGLSRYASPYTVWADKTGRLPEKEDNEAMRTGRDLEDYVARRWCQRTGKKVRRIRAMLYNPDYPFAHADIDRFVVGEDAGLECKTTSALDIRQFEGVDFPEQYYAQCVHYLAVTGCAQWHLAVLVLGRGFFTFTLKRNESEIQALMEAEKAFWEYVAQDKPPEVDGLAATTAAISSVFSRSVPAEVALPPQEGKLLREYAALKQTKKEAQERLDEIENRIKASMQEAETALYEGWKISWKSQERSTFQAANFARDHPLIKLDGYYKKTLVRPFKVTELKAEA